MAATSLRAAGFFLDSQGAPCPPIYGVEPCQCLRCYFNFMQIQVSHNPPTCEARGQHLDLPDVPIVCSVSLSYISVSR